MLRSFNMNLAAFLLNEKQVSEQVEQIEVMKFASEDFWLNTYLWTLDPEKKSQNSQDFSKIWAETSCRSNLTTRRKIVTFSYDHEITQTLTSYLSHMTMKSHTNLNITTFLHEVTKSQKLYCSRMKWRHKKWNVSIILPVIHETSDLAKKMYLQDGNLSVVHQPHSRLWAQERKTHNTMEGCGAIQKKMLGDYNYGLDPF